MEVRIGRHPILEVQAVTSVLSAVCLHHHVQVPHPLLLHKQLQLNIVNAISVVAQVISSQQAPLGHMAMTRKLDVTSAEKSIGLQLFIITRDVIIVVALERWQNEYLLFYSE